MTRAAALGARLGVVALLVSAGAGAARAAECVGSTCLFQQICDFSGRYVPDVPPAITIQGTGFSNRAVGATLDLALADSERTGPLAVEQTYTGRFSMEGAIDVFVALDDATFSDILVVPYEYDVEFTVPWTLSAFGTWDVRPSQTGGSATLDAQNGICGRTCESLDVTSDCSCSVRDACSHRLTLEVVSSGGQVVCPVPVPLVEGLVGCPRRDGLQNIIEAFVAGDVSFTLGGQGVPVAVPVGTLAGHVESDAPFTVEDGQGGSETSFQVEHARVVLWRQADGFLDPTGLPGGVAGLPSAIDRLPELFQPTGRTLDVRPPDAGDFRFDGLPAFEAVPVGGGEAYRPLRYALQVAGASSEEVDLDDSVPGDIVTRELSFTSTARLNLQPELEMPPVHQLRVTPLDAIGKKNDLAASLIEIGPESYQVTELGVQSFLGQLAAGTPTDADVEGVERAVLAERLALAGARDARHLLAAALTGLTNLLGDLFDDFVKSARFNKKARKEFDDLQGQLDLASLENDNWFGISGADEEAAAAIRTAMGKLQRENVSLFVAEEAKVVKAATGALFSLLEYTLDEAGVDASEARGVAQTLKLVLDSGLAILINQGIGGATPLVKKALAEAAEVGREVLFDGPVSYSYTALTLPPLVFSASEMQGWPDDDSVLFQAAQNDVFTVLRQMTNAATSVREASIYTSAIADGLGGAGVDVIGLLGPIGRVAERTAKLVKYGSNINSIVLPAAAVYFEIPGSIEQGTADAFGLSELPAPPSAPAPRTGGGGGITASAHLGTAVATANGAFHAVLATLSTELEAAAILGIVAATSGDAPDTLVDRAGELSTAVSHVLAATAGARGLDGGQELALRRTTAALADFRVAYAREVEQLSRFLLKLLRNEYDGPTDPYFLAARNRAVAAAARLADRGDDLAGRSTSLYDATKALPGRPAVVVESIAVASDDTGADHVDHTPEAFTLTARVRNLGSSDVSGLSAELTVSQVASAVVVSSPAVAPVGGGTLGPDDGAAGAGTDEAEVSWSFTYQGALDGEERILLSVDLLEGGGEPSGFQGFGDVAVLEPDPTRTDSDLDGLPDAYETANGLQVGVDDALDDAEGDGSTNLAEYWAGTGVHDSDSDSDGLEDGEEAVGGVDGFVTDPLLADTDGDGVDDAADGQPLDAGTSAGGMSFGEPVVAPEALTVRLTEAEPLVTVRIGNAGDGPLTWAAVSHDVAIAVVDPSAPGLGREDGILLVRLPVFYDFDDSPSTRTTVTVFDVSGANRDERDITVLVPEAGATGRALALLALAIVARVAPRLRGVRLVGGAPRRPGSATHLGSDS